MVKKIGTLILTLTLVGCGGESSKDSDKGDNTQSAENTPNNKTTPDGKSQAANRGGDNKGSGGRVDGVFTAGKNMQDMNQFKQVALAMHNFHTVYRQFPVVPLKTGKKRHENLSWRVSILPFLELVPEYEKFKEMEAWDSATNKPLAEGKGKDQFKLSNGNLLSTIKLKNQPRALRDIIDGSSNTVMLMENPNASGDQWTQNVDITAEDAVKAVKSLKKGEFLLACFFDGSALKIYSTEGKNVTDEDIMGLFVHNDGKPLNEELLRPGK